MLPLPRPAEGANSKQTFYPVLCVSIRKESLVPHFTYVEQTKQGPTIPTERENLCSCTIRSERVRQGGLTETLEPPVCLIRHTK
jgi:hypothetical protein